MTNPHAGYWPAGSAPAKDAQDDREVEFPEFEPEPTEKDESDAD